MLISWFTPTHVLNVSFFCLAQPTQVIIKKEKVVTANIVSTPPTTTTLLPQQENKYELQLHNTNPIPTSTINQAVAVSLHHPTVGHIPLQHAQTVSNVTTVTLPTIYTTQQGTQLSWTCELCGKMLPNREEWSLHAKSHLEVS